MSIATVKRRPILMRPELVCASLKDLKTQTRRVITPQPKAHGPGVYGSRYAGGPDWGFWLPKPDGRMYSEQTWRCPYGEPGDQLWVRETWRPWEDPKTCIDGILFKADGAFKEIENTREAADKWLEARGDGGIKKWRPSIFMPRWASRLTLGITRVRIERVQEINCIDLRDEGIPCPSHDFASGFCKGECPDLRRGFATGWTKINGDRGFGWDTNPWVWVIDFKRVS